MSFVTPFDDECLSVTQSRSGLVQRGCQHLNHQWKFLIQRNGWIRVHCVSEAANLRVQRVRTQR